MQCEAKGGYANCKKREKEGKLWGRYARVSHVGSYLDVLDLNDYIDSHDHHVRRNE